MKYFLLYLFLEVMFSSWIVGTIGGLATFIEILITAFIGVFLIRNYKYAVVVNLMSLQKGKIDQKDFMKQNLFVALGAILLIIPGFLTDFIGILLQFSFFASLFSSKVLSKNNQSDFNFEQNYRNERYKGDDDVIDVEIIDDKHTIDRK